MNHGRPGFGGHMTDHSHHIPVAMDIDHHVMLSDQMSSHMNPNQITNQMVNHCVPTEHRIVNPHPHSFQLPPQRKRGPDKKVQIGEKCQVCHEQATGFNYGALTCNPCKSFFRRTILENNLTQKCDRVVPCDNRQIRRCIGCRLAKCLKVGMKQDYIRQLRIRSIQRRIDKIPKDKQLLKFSETLDPFQENFLSVLEGFWLIYRDSATMNSEVSIVTNERAIMERTVCDVIADFGQKMSKFKIPNPSFPNSLEGISFVKDFVDLHINMIMVFLEAIPSIRWHQLQEDTKKDIVKYVTMEIPLIRAGSRFLCGIKTQEDQFNKTGLSPKLIGQMFELVGGFCKMQPDSYETCLIAALCATSPDRGIRNATDYKILSNIQETILEILRIKLKIDRKPMRVLASQIAYLQSLRSYSYTAETEWFKFISHKKKIISIQELQSDGNVSEEQSRGGIEYLVSPSPRPSPIPSPMRSSTIPSPMHTMSHSPPMSHGHYSPDVRRQFSPPTQFSPQFSPSSQRSPSTSMMS